MTRWPVLAMAAFTFVASPSLILAAATPAAAQENDWDNGETGMSDGRLRDFLRSWLQDRADRRDMLLDLVQERRDQRDELMDMLQERSDRRGEVAEFLRDHPWLRDRLRERMASRWNDEDGGGALRDRLRDRLASRWNDEGDGGPLRGRLRERLAERMSGDCYILTRSLRNQDGSLLVLVRRRVCRD
ncbi:hypothetical protein [Microvirga lotononidis]|uniref:DUF3106 domain-containing protein n=1 Tax=Microvirga lotononidis TaxID=864069 RepID=I4YZN9_9HYPH|nr:hypothetical protein [Microvirga lotononidis]EIM29431.1 hypothetical protein MicloDRAFT_00019090 [Microvirga lotononidis]WQO27249.1 hypothetical protein U0023_21795 [Microvirga lotononidis]